MVLGELGSYDCTLDPVYQTLKEIQAGKGYYLKLQGELDADLAVPGTLLPVTTRQPLHPYWNWVGYLPPTALPITQALASISGHYLMVLGIDRTYDPAHPELSDLSLMEPGQGYLIRATDAVDLIYPSTMTGTQASPIQIGKKIAQACDGVSPTPYSTLVWGNVTYNGRPAPIGTTIQAITPRGDVAGCTVVRQAGLFGYMRIYGEDSSTPPIPGFRDQERMVFKVDGLTVASSGAETEIWHNDLSARRVDLSISNSTKVYLPLVVRSR
jgi:hypothetical protein